MENLSVLDLLIFVGISQGLFLALSLQLLHKNNKSANTILSILLVLGAIMLSGRMFYFRYESSPFFARLAFLVDAIIFTIGPLIYMYIRRLLHSHQSFYRLPLIVWTPTVIHFFFSIWTFTFSLQELSALYMEGYLTIPFILIEVISILYLFGFLIASAILLVNFKNQEKHFLSYHQSIFKYATVLLGVFTLLGLLWTFSLINKYLPYSLDFPFTYNAMWTVVPIIMYVIGFFSLKQPEIFRLPPILKKKVESKERLSSERIEELSQSLESLLINDKIYLNPKLTLSQLAKQLGASTNDLSWLLNNIHHSSFYDFINTYRVNDFIEKINKGEHQKHTLLALSLDSGFNSKSTFNKAFKSVTKETPSDYVKKITIMPQ